MMRPAPLPDDTPKPDELRLVGTPTVSGEAARYPARPELGGPVLRLTRTPSAHEAPAEPQPAAAAPPTPDGEYQASKLEVASWQVPLLDVVGAVTRHLTLVSVLLFFGVVKAALGLMSAVPFYQASSVAILLPREKPILDATVDTGSLETTQDVARRASSASLTLPPNTDLYVTLLKSYPTLEAMAELFKDRLVETENVPEDHRAPEMVAKIRSMVSIAGTEDGLLTISVVANDPQLAADLANTLIGESENASKSIERQLVLQQAGFLDEARLESERMLEEAETRYSKFTREHGVLDVEYGVTQQIAQAQRMRKSADGLRGELNALLEVRTHLDPTVQQLEARIQSLFDQADVIYDEIGEADGAEFSGLLQVQRDAHEQIVRFRRDLNMTLTAQADIFRIRAEQPTGGMAIVRRAVVPERPKGPSKKGIVGMAIAGALFLAVMAVIVLEQLSLVKRTSALDQRFGAILGNVARWFPVRMLIKFLAPPWRLLCTVCRKIARRPVPAEA